MAFGNSKHPATGEPDPHFEDVAKNQADVIRRLYVEAFARKGISAEDHGDHIETSEGKKYGLHNLIRECLSTGVSERTWRKVCESFLDRMLSAEQQDRDFDNMDDAALAAIAYPRIAADEMLAGGGAKFTFDYGRGLTDGLRAVLVADFPQTVTYLTDDHLAGRDAEALWAAALANLGADSGHEHLEINLSDSDGVIHVWAGDSVYVASQALRLPELLAATELGGEEREGLLVAIPHRNMVAVHIPRDVAQIVAAVTGMANLAVEQFRTAPGAISPNLLWWESGEFEQVSWLGEDGQLKVQPSPRMMRVLNAEE